jgi:carbonic anhydrase
MCIVHRVPQISRRNFSLLAMATAGVGVLPSRARAADIEALGFTCIDYRLVGDGVRFFDSLKLTKEYDQLALAGAALGAVSPKFPSSNSAFWDQLEIAISLHHIKKVVVVDHRDCGAYKVAFGPDYASEHDAETKQHKGVMLTLQSALAKRHPKLGAEFYLMALDGAADRIV